MTDSLPRAAPSRGRRRSRCPGLSSPQHPFPGRSAPSRSNHEPVEPLSRPRQFTPPWRAAHAPCRGCRRRSSMTPLRALVCDDEAPLPDLMARRAEKLGLQVDKAPDGKAGLGLIAKNKYDLIITDIYMPEVTGLELLEAAKAQDREIQVVIVTASATVENAIEAINLGAFCYLTKPFDHLSVFDNAVMRAQELRPHHG